MKLRKLLITTTLFLLVLPLAARERPVRKTYNFNSDWLLHIGDDAEAVRPDFDDSDWQSITLPRAFNEDEAFRLHIKDLTDTVVWYRKHFRLPKHARRGKAFIEFEGVRQRGDFYLNGHALGLHENGVMAVGFDLTPYLVDGENVLAVRIDNDWDYHEQATATKFQWSDRNFNANYGGIPKNVRLHLTGDLYQTLPLYSTLGTTGVYVYATDIDIPAHRATIHAESEVRNESTEARRVRYAMFVHDRDGRRIAAAESEPVEIAAGSTATLRTETLCEGLHFWSWGYGYLYTVETQLVDAVSGRAVDAVKTRTGFRKTDFADGKVRLNDRVLQLKGFAQRTSNEWPAVGMSVPAWLSDFSNGLMVEANANLVRWMHVTPWKQDVESCDRVGLIQAMPAGDAEKDREGRQWEQRKELMRDAIIYNRNNPSILFYECGNKAISREHMLEMKALRDRYDPHGGRAIGSREMLDICEAEYGGEMLYINKSAHHPMWAMEYSRDEGLRKYWDAYSYPYHKEGDGPLYRGQDASDYNHNQDMLAVEGVRRWYDYWLERPGTGRRVSSGGTKIIFSDTNTHQRGEANYRTSGVVDPMRIPKDAFFAHQAMWDGWVDTEHRRTHLIGHWNYPAGTVKPVYVVSTYDDVELRLNGRPVGEHRRDYHFLHTFENVAFEPGRLEVYSSCTDPATGERRTELTNVLETAGEPARIRLRTIENPTGWKADGADMALVEVEVCDAAGRRCPLDDRTIHFELEGPAEWRGGIAAGPDNCILSRDLPVECGVNRVLLRSTCRSGRVTLRATADGVQGAETTLTTHRIKTKDGLSEYLAGDALEGRLTRGETPAEPSYRDTKRDVAVVSAAAGANEADACKSFDDNELSEWRNDGRASTAWITYRLAERAAVDEICMKLTGWRLRSYPLEIRAGDELIWSGETPKSLGYVHLHVKPVETDEITIRLAGTSEESDAFGQIVEIAEPVANDLDLYKSKSGDRVGHELRIVEIEFLLTR